MRKHKAGDLKFILLGILAVFTFSCNSKTANNSINNLNPSASESTQTKCQTIKHDIDKTKICGQPQKIAVLGPNALEIIIALKVQPAAYADHIVFHRGDFDNPSQQIPYIGKRITSQPINLGKAAEPSLETLAKFKPDLIIGNVLQHKSKYALLSQIAPTLLFKMPLSGGNWQDGLQVTAQALGRTQQAQKVIESHNKKLASTREQLQNFVAANPRALILNSDDLNQNFYLMSATSPCGRLVQELGFKVVSLSKEKPQPSYQNISLEILNQLDSDLILFQGFDFSQPEKLADVKDIETYQIKNIKKQWENNPITQSMNASKQGQVYFSNAYLCSAFPGPVGSEIFLKQLSGKLLSQNKINEKP